MSLWRHIPLSYFVYGYDWMDKHDFKTVDDVVKYGGRGCLHVIIFEKEWYDLISKALHLFSFLSHPLFLYANNIRSHPKLGPLGFY